MKRVFQGITYLLLLVMMFVYMLISCVKGNLENQAILTAVGFTGVSVIGWLFVIPAFVFTIVSLCSQGPMKAFIRDMLATFAGVFILASVIIAFFLGCATYYVPIILLVCCVILLAFSITGVIKGIINEDKRKKEEKEQAKIQQELIQ